MPFHEPLRAGAGRTGPVQLDLLDLEKYVDPTVPILPKPRAESTEYALFRPRVADVAASIERPFGVALSRYLADGLMPDVRPVVMQAAALLNDFPDPTDEDINASAAAMDAGEGLQRRSGGSRTANFCIL